MNSLGDSPVTYGFSAGIPLNIWLICGKDPNFKWISLLYAFAWGVLNIALKFSRSYLDRASLKPWYFDLIVCYATLECNVSDTGHDDTPSQYTDRKPTCFIIHWCGTSHWNHNHPFSCLASYREILQLPSTHEVNVLLSVLLWQSSVESEPKYLDIPAFNIFIYIWVAIVFWM